MTNPRDFEKLLIENKHLIQRLIEAYKNLPEGYKCPFCGYISRHNPNRPIKVYREIDYDDPLHEDYHDPGTFGYFGANYPRVYRPPVRKEVEIEFCFCPRCKTPPPTELDDRHGAGDFEAWPVKIMTPEFRQLLDEVKAFLQENDIEIRCYAPALIRWRDKYIDDELADELFTEEGYRLFINLAAIVKNPPKEVRLG